MGSSISSVLDPDRGSGEAIPDGYVTPSFPSLYLPSFENTEAERGIFLYQAEDVWRFTVYWTLLLLAGIFLICSLLASFTLLLSLTIFRDYASSSSSEKGRSVRPKRKKPPYWPLLVLPVVMTGVAALVALISGTVVGFALAAVYSAGGFSMSTWVPFLWALIQVIVLIIASYSTLTSIL